MVLPGGAGLYKQTFLGTARLGARSARVNRRRPPNRRRRHRVIVATCARGPMSADPKCLPWQDWREFVEVGTALFAHDAPELQVASLQRVAAWRVRGRVPHRVDLTAQLVEVMMHDAAAGASAAAMAMGGSHGAAVLSESMLQNNYAIAVLRAVNGVVDSGQKGTYATSVSVLASRVGLPGWLVDLRHDTSHNALPSLSTLRLAATTLLHWLHSEYWEAQTAQLRAVDAACAAVLHHFVDGGRNNSGADDDQDGGGGGGGGGGAKDKAKAKRKGKKGADDTSKDLQELERERELERRKEVVEIVRDIPVPR